MKPGRILVVGDGNVCRSPVFHLLLARAVQGTGVIVGSAGLTALPDDPIERAVQHALVSRGIEAAYFTAREATPELLDSADLVLAVDRVVRTTTVQYAPAVLRRTFAVVDFSELLSQSTRDRLWTFRGSEQAPADGLVDELVNVAHRRRPDVQGVSAGQARIVAPVDPAGIERFIDSAEALVRPIADRLFEMASQTGQ
ncbi:hypothetical protein [Rudaeicoccus suwonensis]|nr:hypothetical protein [Rudaeicoccus suwonensis]